MQYKYSKKINTRKNSLNRRHRMIDPDSYTVDPYQDIDDDTPPNFLQDLHSWVSNLGSKIHDNIKDMQKSYTPTPLSSIDDTEFANSGMHVYTHAPSPMSQHRDNESGVLQQPNVFIENIAAGLEPPSPATSMTSRLNTQHANVSHRALRPARSTRSQLKNINWALEHFPYQGPETIPQQLFVNSETGTHIQIFNITRSQHAYMLALYDANVDSLLMSKLVLLLGEHQAKMSRVKRTKPAISMR